MLNPVERERIEQLENEISSLRDEVAVQRILVSGLIHSLFRTDSANQSAFFELLREELNKLPLGSGKQQEFTHLIQTLIDRYR